MTHPSAATATATSTAPMKVPSNLAFEFAVFRFVTISLCFCFLCDVAFVVVFIFCSTGTRRKCVACGTWKRAIADGYSSCCCCSAAIFEIRRAYFSYFCAASAASSRHIWIVLPLTVFVAQRDHNSNCKNNSKKKSKREEKLMLSCALNISTFSFGFFYPSYSVPRLSPSLLPPRSTAFLPRIGHLLFFVCTFSARSSSFFHSFFLPVYFTSMCVRAPSWQLCCHRCEGKRWRGGAGTTAAQLCACSWCWLGCERMRAKETVRPVRECDGREK